MKKYIILNAYICLYINCCSPGYYLSSGNCIPCHPGYYSSSSNSKDCLPCPIGTYSYSGSFSCIPCRDGYISHPT